MKRIVFVVHRNTFYRLYTPLIEEALSRGFNVELWHDYSHPRKGLKGYSFPDLDSIPKVKNRELIKVSSFLGKEGLRTKIIGLGSSDVLFALESPCFYWTKESINLDFQWITLQHGLDSFYELTDIKENLFNNSLFAVYTDKWLELGKDFLSKFSGRKDTKVVDNFSVKVVGQPEFDSFKYLKSQEVIRKEYGIPKDKKVLLYLPFPYQNWNPNSAWEKAFAGLRINTMLTKNDLWDHNKKMPLFSKLFMDAKYMKSILKDPDAFSYWRRGINEDNVFGALKKFAVNNNLFIVVKPRLKFPITEYIKKNADLLVLDDENQNMPTRLKELLSVARLTVSYYSLSVLTAAFANVYHINITTPKAFFPDEKGKFFYPETPRTLFNYEGVTFCCSPEEIISKVKDEDIARFSVDPLKRKQYIKEYVGFDDYNSSKRVFDLC